VVVVDCPVDLAVERLVAQRGFDRADAEARVASQTSREERLAGADLVVDNSTSRDSLVSQVDELWRILVIEREERPRRPGNSREGGRDRP
jgi:dephospho-CoA kinase